MLYVGFGQLNDVVEIWIAGRSMNKWGQEYSQGDQLEGDGLELLNDNGM